MAKKKKIYWLKMIKSIYYPVCKTLIIKLFTKTKVQVVDLKGTMLSLKSSVFLQQRQMCPAAGDEVS